MSSLLLLQAADYAARMHRNQKRKDPDATPYINHPIRVARLIAEVGGVDDPDALAAALLHDTIEDTEATEADLRALFGDTITDLVLEVTDDKSLEKSVRKLRQVEHARELSPRAALVKLADKICNIHDVAHHSPSGWSRQRCVEYLDWGKSVVDQVPPGNAPLLARFNEEYKTGMAIIEARG